MQRILISHVLAPLLACGLLGCGGNDDLREFSESDDVENTAPEHGHGHDHDLGPHKGHLVELGDEEYHAEVTFQADSRTIGIYLLGPDAETPAVTKATELTLRLTLGEETKDLTLTAASQDGSEASYFEISGDAIPEAVHDIEEVQGELVIDIDGTSYRGKIVHDHGDHGHTHD